MVWYFINELNIGIKCIILKIKIIFNGKKYVLKINLWVLVYVVLGEKVGIKVIEFVNFILSIIYKNIVKVLIKI